MVEREAWEKLADTVLVDAIMKCSDSTKKELAQNLDLNV